MKNKKPTGTSIFVVNCILFEECSIHSQRLSSKDLLMTFDVAFKHNSVYQTNEAGLKKGLLYFIGIPVWYTNTPLLLFNVSNSKIQTRIRFIYTCENFESMFAKNNGVQ